MYHNKNIARKLTIAALAFTSFAAKNTFADIVLAQPPGSGTFYAPVAPSNSGDNFYSNPSIDATGNTNQCNVGYWLASTNWNTTASQCGKNLGSNGYSGTSGPGNLPFYANVGTPTLPVGFLLQNTGTNTVTLRLQDAGDRNTDAFGYYVVDPNGSYTSGQLGEKIDRTILLPGADNPPTTATFTLAPGQEFGFFLCPNGNCGTATNDKPVEYSSAPVTSSNTEAGKFALFAETPGVPSKTDSLSNFWLGVEDQGGNTGLEKYGDYQDLLLHITATPEPGFYGVLGLSLAVLFLFFARKRKTA